MPGHNILFFTCHDLGRFLGCYDHPTIHSPALDSLAASGVRFSNFFCTAPQCSPSRASLHTGRYPHSTGVMGLAHHPFGWRLGPNEKHLACRLSETGYASILVGMQHLIDRGEARELGYERVLPVEAAPNEAEATTALLAELARADRPFYLEVGFEEPHRPYDFGGAQPDDSLGVEIPGYLPDVPEARADMAAFQGAVSQMDGAVGRIFAALEREGLAETTWVIFCSDHGIAMPRAKGTLYDPGIEIPMIMRWPTANIAGGRVFGELLSNVDVVPTMLEALAQAVPPEVQGRSFWPLLVGGHYTPRSEIYAEKTFHTYYEPMRAVRTPTHKYILNFEVSTAVDVPADVRESPVYPLMRSDFGKVRPNEELYDLRADPLEQENLAGQHDTQDLQADLRARLLAWMQATDDPLLKGPVPSPYYYSSLSSLGVSRPLGS